MNSTRNAVRVTPLVEAAPRDAFRMIDALAERGAALFSRARDRWLQRQRAKSIRDALSLLDDRMLHDLGLHRSEIGSVAAEVTGVAERTRLRARP